MVLERVASETRAPIIESLVGLKCFSQLSHPRSKCPDISVYLIALRLYNQSLSTCFAELRSRIIPCKVDATCGLDSIRLDQSTNLPIWLPRHAPQLSLDIVEQLFDGIQPGRVLGIEKNIRFELPSCLVDDRVFVNSCVVHEDHDVLRLRVFVRTELVQSTVQEVVEHYGICASLSDLRGDNTVLSDCSDHRK